MKPLAFTPNQVTAATAKGDQEAGEAYLAQVEAMCVEGRKRGLSRGFSPLTMREEKLPG